MALTVAWTALISGQTDADSPVNQTLTDAYRTRAEHNYNWIGKDYTPDDNHDHDGVNSKGVANTTYIAGDYLIAFADTTDNYGTDTTWQKVKEFALARNGELRIKFDLRSVVGATVHGQIRKNGVAEGTDQTTTSGTFVTKSEDLSGWVAGDLLQLYVKTETGGQAVEWENCRLYNIVPVAISVDLDS